VIVLTNILLILERTNTRNPAFMKKLILGLIVFISLSFSKIEKNEAIITRFELNENATEILYKSIDFGAIKPDFTAFSLGLQGFEILKAKGLIKNNILTLIDFSLSSKYERMWVIDMESGKTIFNTLVAHGRNSGEEFARYFGNEMSSYKSSLGFYLTSELYHGKHGLSLKLDGLEKGINDMARERAIVIHGADYVSKEFVAQHGRLGRSLGCPALPQNLNESIITTIKGQSALFIYHPDSDYSAQSTLINNGTFSI
jgi:hypothetical protein